MNSQIDKFWRLSSPNLCHLKPRPLQRFGVFHNSVDVVSGFSRTPPKVRLKADATYNWKSL